MSVGAPRDRSRAGARRCGPRPSCRGADEDPKYRARCVAGRDRRGRGATSLVVLRRGHRGARVPNRLASGDHGAPFCRAVRRDPAGRGPGDRRRRVATGRPLRRPDCDLLGDLRRDRPPVGADGAAGAAFPETGLRPLCWGWRQDEVDTLFRKPPITRDEIAAVEIEALARRCWADRAFSPSVIRPLDTAFPGLAGPLTAVPELDGPFDIVDEKMGWQDVAGRQILLVPCNRPADALGVIAWEGQRLVLACRRY